MPNKKSSPRVGEDIRHLSPKPHNRHMMERMGKILLTQPINTVQCDHQSQLPKFLSTKGIWEIVHPSRESKSRVFFLCKRNSETNSCDSNLKKEVLIRAADRYSCLEIYSKETKDLVISMFSIG